MATLIHGKSSFGVSLPSLLSDAKAYSSLGTQAFAAMGDDTDEQNGNVAWHINELVRDFLRKNTNLANKEATLSLVSGQTKVYELPSDLRDLDLFEMKVVDDNDVYPPQGVRFIGRRRIRTFPESETVVGFWEGFEAALSEDGQYLRLNKEVATSFTLKAYYSIQAASISAANVATPAAVNIPELPTYARKWAGLKLASALVEAAHPDGSRKTESLRARAEDEMERVSEIIEGIIGAYPDEPIIDRQATVARLGDYYYDTA